MKEYCEEVQGVDTEETRLAGSESVAGVSQCTQHTPQLHKGWLSLPCKGNKPFHSAPGTLVALIAFVSNLFGKKNLTPGYDHRSYAFSS